MRQKKTGAFRPWILGAAVLLSASGAAFAADETPRKGGTVIITLGTDPPTVNPITTSGVPDHIIGCMTSQGLTKETYTGDVIPELAISWSVSPDGRTYTFDLREAKWHDGKPFQSADVKFTLEAASKVSPTFATVGKLLESVEAPEPHKAVIKLKEPFGPFLISLACPLGSAIIPKHIFEGTNLQQNPSAVGTGPYKLVEWQHGSHLRLVRNPDYWEPGKPYLDTVIAKIIPQGPARTQALIAGEVDFISYYYFPNADYKTVRDNPKLKIVQSATPPSNDFMFINTTRKPLDDKRVRQALMIAMDRDFLVRNAWQGNGQPGQMPFTSQIPWAANPDVDYRKMYPFDPAKANAMLDEVGLKRGADGTRFKLTMVVAPDDVEYGPVSSAIKVMWAAVGVALTIEANERATALKRVYVDKDFDIAMNGYGTYNEPALGLSRAFTTSGIGRLYGNGSAYSNPQVDELFKKGESATDRAERGGYYKQAQAILADELPVITLREKGLLDVVNKNVNEYLDEAHATSWRKAWLSP